MAGQARHLHPRGGEKADDFLGRGYGMAGVTGVEKIKPPIIDARVKYKTQFIP